MLTSQIAEKISESVARSPSLHNCQPFRMSCAGDTIFILEDPRRKLKIADPKNLDHEMSLGVWLEGLRLALEEHDLYIENQMELNELVGSSPLIRRVQIKVGRKNPTEHKDPLVSFVNRRKSYRGVFKSSDISVESVSSIVQSIAGAAIIKNNLNVLWHKEYDTAAEHLYKLDGYWRELFSWMRFSKSDPNYGLDGLNAEAMALSGPEAFFAQFFLQPPCFSILQKLKLAHLLTTESAQIKSSLGFCLLKGKPGESRIELGRKFYQIWLKMTEARVFACPMSSLIDTNEGKEFLSDIFQLSKDEEPVAIWRFGSIPNEKVYFSPRISAQELLVKDI